MTNVQPGCDDVSLKIIAKDFLSNAPREIKTPLTNYTSERVISQGIIHHLEIVPHVHR